MLGKFQQSMKDALKGGDKAAVSAYRNIIAKLKMAQINSGKPLSEEDAIKILASHVKQLKDSIAQYESANRMDLVEGETFELQLMDKYLPKQMSEDEIRQIVKNVISDIGAESIKDMGRVMPGVMKAIAGKGDGKLAQAIVRELLS
ncbi:MAG: GatB/YqeY domain-containing protein [Candidatus Marinimicrobia bacterium]|nr:GatB/YqeY domain-containing protein [Candidatus Neomarinimicrobiota bacterium]